MLKQHKKDLLEKRTKFSTAMNLKIKKWGQKLECLQE